MSLAVGTFVGPYEVVAPLGAGGMGEVYRGRDAKLSRDVALKVLPALFAADVDRLARFKREAQVLASLNHPNIAAIHGFEDGGGVHALVLELVEGPTLADRIARGPIPLEDALPIAHQIAEALEAAHERGIVHRDLKPANIKLRPDGAVKVLDFGLAKLTEADRLGPAAGVASQSPTITSPAMMTGVGVLLGTAAYMSPEQARGKTVDKRADIWAFGCVLYELLTGTQAFRGENVTETLAGVLKGEPDWQALPAETPHTVRALLRRCLQKDAKQRFRDAGDIRLQLEEVHAIPLATVPGPPGRLPSRVPWRWMTLTGLVCFLGGGIIAGVAVWRMKPAPVYPVSRTVVALSAGQRLGGLDSRVVALSSDGTQLAYIASDGGEPPRIFVRPLDSLQARSIAGTEFASNPFFSPDGQWIGFFADGGLKKVQVSGGTTVTLGDVGQGTGLTNAPPPGASWGPNDTIVFAAGNFGTLRTISAAGGAPQPLTTLTEGEVSHRWPEFLPGGSAIVFTAMSGGTVDSRIEVQRLDTGERKVLIRGGTDGRYVPTGHLVYYRSGTVMAVPFDLARLEVAGPPAPVLEGVMASSANTGAGEFSISRVGSMVYLPGGGRGQNDLRLTWVDRKGTTQPLPAPPRPYGSPVLSRDGRFVLTEIGNDIWLYDLTRNTLTRLTFEGRNQAPKWTADGKRVAYQSIRGGATSIFWRLADSSGPEEQLLTGISPRPASFTPDARTLVFTDTNPKTGNDLWVVPLEGERKPYVFLQTPFSETTPQLSPDGKWVAYLSNESGRNEVYVRPFPGPGGKWQISTDGGQGLSWSPKGNELFYRSDPQNPKMMAVDIQTEPSFNAANPRLLFETSPRVAVTGFAGVGADYSVSPDGQRFLMVQPREQAQPPLTQINVVMNWTEELKRLVPTN